jgi:outer membrane protein assembly factor BamB
MMFRTRARPRVVAIVVGVALGAVALLVPASGQAGRAPALAWSPTTSTGTFDYGAVDVGQTASQTFTLTNSGGSASAALTVALSGSAAFTKTADTCAATSLGPKKTCTVSVQYAPTVGGSDQATLTAAGNKPAASASLALTGTGAVPLVNWPMFHNTLDHVGWNTSETILSPTTVSGLTPKWSTTTGNSFSSPAVANGVVYVGSFDHKVYALDASTGAVDWSTTTGNAVFSSPAVANGVVYVGSFDQKVYAFGLPG